MKHLTINTQGFVIKSSDGERIKFAQEFKWIGYSQSKTILKKMEDCMNYPKCHRMPNILLVGDSNNGKTAILSKFKKQFIAYIDEDTKKVINPVVMIQAPPEPDEKRFYNAILEVLFAPYKTSEKVEVKYMRVKKLLVELEVKILIIDEIHHVLAGAPSKQRKFLNVIKHLSNDLQIPIVCSGTKLAFNVIQTDQQLANRFEPRVLKRWANDIEFKRLLLSFERILPLKKESNLIENSMTSKILNLSDGLIGEVAKILELSAILAIESGEEKITKAIVDKIDYIPSSKRNKRSFY